MAIGARDFQRLYSDGEREHMTSGLGPMILPNMWQADIPVWLRSILVSNYDTLSGWVCEVPGRVHALPSKACTCPLAVTSTLYIPPCVTLSGPWPGRGGETRFISNGAPSWLGTRSVWRTLSLW